MLTGGVLRVENLLGTWAGACFAGHEDQNCASSTNSRGEPVGVNGTDLTAFQRGLKIQWSIMVPVSAALHDYWALPPLPRSLPLALFAIFWFK